MKGKSSTTLTHTWIVKRRKTKLAATEQFISSDINSSKQLKKLTWFAFRNYAHLISHFHYLSTNNTKCEILRSYIGRSERSLSNDCIKIKCKSINRLTCFFGTLGRSIIIWNWWITSKPAERTTHCVGYIPEKLCSYLIRNNFEIAKQTNKWTHITYKYQNTIPS